MSSVPARPKPAHGQPCNGCGGCCQDRLCPLGFKLFGSWRGPCAALQHGIDGEYVCGLVAAPQRWNRPAVDQVGAAAVSRAAATLIGAGVGCDAVVAGERINIDFSNALRARPITMEVLVARSIWGFK